MNQAVHWSPGVTLEMIEKQVILNAFRFYRGNKTQTAISLGIAIRTLETKLERYEHDGKEQLEREQRDDAERAAILDKQRGIYTDPKTGERRVYGSNTGVHESANNTERLRSEPTTNTESLHNVSVQKRQEIPLVLPKVDAKNNTARRR